MWCVTKVATYPGKPRIIDILTQFVAKRTRNESGRLLSLWPTRPRMAWKKFSLILVYFCKYLTEYHSFSLYWMQHKSSTFKHVVCDTRSCLFFLDGKWSRWSSWTDCSRSCGKGRQSRTRVCTNKATGKLLKNGWCAGKPRQEDICADWKCPGMRFLDQFFSAS